MTDRTFVIVGAGLAGPESTTKLEPGARTSFGDVGLGVPDSLELGEVIAGEAAPSTDARGDGSLASGAMRLPQPTRAAITPSESAARMTIVFIGGVLLATSVSRSTKRTTGTAR